MIFFIVHRLIVSTRNLKIIKTYSSSIHYITRPASVKLIAFSIGNFKLELRIRSYSYLHPRQFIHASSPRCINQWTGLILLLIIVNRRSSNINIKRRQEHTVALCHLKWVLKSANPLIIEQPLKRTIEDNLFLLFFLSGWTVDKK